MNPHILANDYAALNRLQQRRAQAIAELTTMRADAIRDAWRMACCARTSPASQRASFVHLRDGASERANAITATIIEYRAERDETARLVDAVLRKFVAWRETTATVFS